MVCIEWVITACPRQLRHAGHDEEVHRPDDHHDVVETEDARDNNHPIADALEERADSPDSQTTET